jgi:aminoglycoside/choline kinase family phosphotransferase
MTAREDMIGAFLARAGWGDASRAPLAGDASTRRYERLRGRLGAAVLMDAPPGPDGPPLDGRKAYSAIAHLAEDCRPFVAVGRALRHVGLSAPTLLAHDVPNGLLLLEDLGDALYGYAIDMGKGPNGESLDEMYRTGVDALVAWHAGWAAMGAPSSLSVPGSDRDYVLPVYDEAALAIETELLTDWYLPAKRGLATSEGLRAEYRALWRALFPVVARNAQTLALRDFHSPNMLWLAARRGPARVGLIDFQDALIGSRAYDLVSFLQDARKDVPPAREDAMLGYYCRSAAGRLADFDETRFRAAYAVLGAQRNSKIIGIFVRLHRRDGKPQYLAHIPRVARYLERDLAHPALADLRRWLDALVPAPERLIAPGA